MALLRTQKALVKAPSLRELAGAARLREFSRIPQEYVKNKMFSRFRLDFPAGLRYHIIKAYIRAKEVFPPCPSPT